MKLFVLYNKCQQSVAFYMAVLIIFSAASTIGILFLGFGFRFPEWFQNHQFIFDAYRDWPVYCIIICQPMLASDMIVFVLLFTSFYVSRVRIYTVSHLDKQDVRNIFSIWMHLCWLRLRINGKVFVGRQFHVKMPGRHIMRNFLRHFWCHQWYQYL